MADSSNRSRGLLVLWHLSALAALGLLLPELRFHLPLWELKSSEQWPFKVLLAGYALSALLPALLSALRRPLSIGYLIAATMAVFGAIFLYFLLTNVDSKRILMVQVLAAAVVLVPLGWYLLRLRWVGILVLAVAAAVGLGIELHKSKSTDQAHQSHMDATIIRTAFYNVRTVSYVDFIPPPAVRGGGLSKIGDDYLLATGDGFLYLFGWGKDSDALNMRRLPYRVPLNGDEFAKDTTGGVWHKPQEGDALSVAGEDAGSTIITWWFRTVGLLVDEKGEHLRVFASHYYWKHDASCWVERVSLLEGSRAAFMGGAKDLTWRTIFETTPCLPIKGEGRRRGTPFAGHFGGGRMVLRDPDTLLLTVGDFGFNGVSSQRMVSQDMSASYGKTMLIHLQDNRSEIFTSGNRNAQGLYIDPSGKIWETEHGPQGGDELNLLKQGLNYGWPVVTYGVDYGTFGWPLNPRQGEHDGFEAPYFAWLPSIATSNLVGVEKDLFPIWHGDLLVTSLVAQTIFRVRIRNDRVAYAEPIAIGRRIRDITEGADGRIVLWADDDNAIVSLRPNFGNSGDVAFATYCSGCHKVADGNSHRIGPDLWGVIGRKVASADGYADYSAALHHFGGEWTESRLNGFIRNPQATVPGTSMEFGGVADGDARAKIVDYLRNAKKVVSR